MGRRVVGLRTRTRGAGGSEVRTIERLCPIALAAWGIWLLVRGVTCTHTDDGKSDVLIHTTAADLLMVITVIAFIVALLAVAWADWREKR